MNKLTTVTRPAALILSLVAAFGAHAQVANDDADRAGYGPSTGAAVAKVADKRTAREVVVVASKSVATASAFDAADRSGYGPTPATSSLRTRAEVRAEAIAARDAGYQAMYLEGADPQAAVFARSDRKAVDSTHAMARHAAKAAQ
jgi:hypothetical protein